MDGPGRLKPRPGRRQQDVADCKASPTPAKKNSTPTVGAVFLTGSRRRARRVSTADQGEEKGPWMAPVAV